MIIIFDENEKSFTTLGIGVLSDAITCEVTEELNGIYELEMTYPISGSHYSDIKNKRILKAKPNDILDYQLFRIYKITKPIDGIITVYAWHISYDMTNVPVKPFYAENLADLITKLNDKSLQLINNDFHFSTTKVGDAPFELKNPCALRSLILGESNSVIQVYEGEFSYNNFEVILESERGSDRGYTIIYSKNMLELENELSSEAMYTGVYPYYLNVVTENKTGMIQNYDSMFLSKEALDSDPDVRLVPEDYIDPDTGEEYEIYPDKFFSYNSEGVAGFIISLLNVPNIISAGDDPQNPDATYTYPDGTKKSLLNHIFIAKKIRTAPDDPKAIGKFYVDVTGVISYIRKGAKEYSSGWLSTTDPDKDTLAPAIIPEPGKVYRIFSNDNNYKYKSFEWDTTVGQYIEWQGPDGEGDPYKPKKSTVSTEQETSDILVTLDENIIFINEVRAKIAIEPTNPATQGSIIIDKTSNEYRQYTLDIGAELSSIEIDSEKSTEAGAQVYKYYNTQTKQTYYFALTYENPSLLIINYPTMVATKQASVWLTKDIYNEADLRYCNKRYNEDPNKFAANWLKSQKWDTVKAEFVDDQNPLIPVKNTPYTIFTPGIFYGKTCYWDGVSSFIEVNSTDIRQSIATIDLTDKFTQPPSQIELYNEALKYIQENNLGQLNETIKVSFLKLSANPEYSKWRDLEHIELGDTVSVTYDKLGINVKKRVVKTVYNVLEETYSEIELGKKSSTFTSNVIMSSDNVSDLTNDRNFMDSFRVSELVADSITAEKIKALTAEITDAQIEQLKVSQIDLTGCLQASQATIDELVAKMLVADNAAIKEQLTVGESLVINGTINVRSGTISIIKDENITFTVAYINPNAEYDCRSDWLKSDYNSEEIIHPEENVIYKVYDTHKIWTQEYYSWSLDDQMYKVRYDIEPTVYFEVDSEGNLKANNVDLTGKITATSGEIGGCTIEIDPITGEGVLKVANANIDGTLSADHLNLKGIRVTDSSNKPTFVIDQNGNVAVQGTIILTDGNLEDILENIDNSIESVEQDASDAATAASTAQTTANNAATAASTAQTTANNAATAASTAQTTANAAKAITDNLPTTILSSSGIVAYNSSSHIDEHKTFELDAETGDVFIKGTVEISDGEINLGYVTPEEGSPYYNFKVTNEGEVTAKSITIMNGTVNTNDGNLNLSSLNVVDLLLKGDIDSEVDTTINAYNLTIKNKLEFPNITIQEQADYKEETTTRNVTYKADFLSTQFSDGLYSNKVWLEVTISPSYDDDISDAIIYFPYTYALSIIYSDGTSEILNPKHTAISIPAGNNSAKDTFSLNSTSPISSVNYYIPNKQNNVNVTRKYIDESYYNTTLNIEATNLIGIDSIGTTGNLIQEVHAENFYVYSDIYLRKWYSDIPATKSRWATFSIPIIFSGCKEFSTFSSFNNGAHNNWQFLGFEEIFDDFNSQYNSITIDSIVVTQYGNEQWVYENYHVWWGTERSSDGQLHHGIFVYSNERSIKTFCYIIVAHLK